MSDELPRVTIIIAARPEQAGIKAVDAAKRLEYPADRLEVLVARGRQPSVQRNTALKAARGELIYFLDDDSVPRTANLRIGVAHFAAREIKMVGGPNLCPPEAPLLEQVFAVVMASWLAFGPSRARYAAVGEARVSGEKELILCNLLARRDALVESGGFNEALYPNEENALMDELRNGGGKLIYDPRLIVYRRPRSSLRAFARMLRTYGRGRAEQFRLHPTAGSILNFVPPLFCVYLLVLLAMMVLPAGEALGEVTLWLAAPLAVYFGAVLVQTLASIPTGGLLRAVMAMPLLPMSHILYGYGFWRGLFTQLQRTGSRTDVPVQVETVAL